MSEYIIILHIDFLQYFIHKIRNKGFSFLKKNKTNFYFNCIPGECSSRLLNPNFS